MVADPDDFDAKIAGWWVWGQSSWIGHGWCDPSPVRQSAGCDKRPDMSAHRAGGKGVSMQRDVEDKRPKVPDGGGSGVSAQRDRVPGDKRPDIDHKGGGQGVQIQRVAVSGPTTWDRAPRVHQSFTGQGVQIQRPVAGGDPLTGERLRPWFRAIAERLARVIILNRSWESALTDSVLQQTPSSPKPSVGVFLDPPYRTTRRDGGKRSTGLYQGDTTGSV